MSFNLSRLSQKFLNNFTPFQELSHIVTAHDDKERTNLKILSVVSAIITLGFFTLIMKMYSAYKFGKHELTPLQEALPTSMVAGAHFLGPNKQRPLKFKHIDVLNVHNQQAVLSLEMENFTAVCPFKPCGYSEFDWATIANHGKPKHEAYKKNETFFKEHVPIFCTEHIFDNIQGQKIIKDGEKETGLENWAAHGETLRGILQLNSMFMTRGKNHQPEVQELIKDLKKAVIKDKDESESVSKKKEAEVARLCIELGKIPNSLGNDAFHALFGDVRELLTNTPLPKPLENFKKLCFEFPKHKIETLRNVAAYFYHEGFKAPLKEAREVLKHLKPNTHYIIQDCTLYEVQKS